MKRVRVMVKLPDLPASHTFQEAHGEASTVQTAIRRACDEVWARTPVKGRRIKSGTITFTVEQDGKAEDDQE